MTWSKPEKLRIAVVKNIAQQRNLRKQLAESSREFEKEDVLLGVKQYETTDAKDIENFAVQNYLF